MGSNTQVLSDNHDLPIRCEGDVHRGKVRSVYWLSADDSRRLVADRHYDVPADTPLALMVISDRISAFDCIWHAQGGMHGVPGKGAALNAISHHWFKLFREKGLADSHILEVPHPLVWIVQRADPILIEAICRQYITGSMWRAYDRGERNFCGNELPDGLEKNQKLPEILVTPSTKGVLTGIPGVPEADDVNITRENIVDNYKAFNFRSLDDIERYEKCLLEGFQTISDALAELDQVFVDTKFEFGYVKDTYGNEKMIYMDEVGTPDSSRIWDGPAYREGNVVENSKEEFRQMLLSHFDDSGVLLDKDRMSERTQLAADHELPRDIMLRMSEIYLDIAEKITGSRPPVSESPKDEICDVLGSEFRLID